MKTQIVQIPKLKCDITYTIGQNANENDQLIANANPGDLWFHVNNKKSCHVIATVPDTIDRKDLKYIVNQGAVICKMHSYPSEKNLPIVFTRVRNIQKTDTPGTVIIPEENKSIKIC